MSEPTGPSGPRPAAPPPAGYPSAPPAGYQAPPPGYPPLPPGYRYVLPAVAPDGRPLASFGDRLLARLIDGLILGAVGVVLAIPVFVVFLALLPASGTGGRAESGNLPGLFLAVLGVEAGWFVLVLAATYLYEVELLLRNGQTIGKRVMKIKVIPLAPGAPLTRRPAAVRWLVGTIAPAFVPLFNWLDGLWQLWDKPYRQCLHDKASGTAVVKLPG